jgi:hypothetical protein
VTGPVWSVRVRTAGSDALTVVGAAGSFAAGAPLAFQPIAGPPTALELFLGALGADIAGGFRAAAARRRLPLEELELVVRGELDNPLLHLGVVGETGHPGLRALEVTLYVSSDADPAALEAAWAEALARSPLVATLRPAVPLALRLVLA